MNNTAYQTIKTFFPPTPVEETQTVAKPVKVTAHPTDEHILQWATTPILDRWKSGDGKVVFETLVGVPGKTFILERQREGAFHLIGVEEL